MLLQMFWKIQMSNFGMQGMQDIGTFFGIHLKQMMTSPEYIKIAGEWETTLAMEYGKKIDRGRIGINPVDIDVHFRTIVRDGSVPGGNFAEVWVRLFQVLGQNPEHLLRLL